MVWAEPDTKDHSHRRELGSMGKYKWRVMSNAKTSVWTIFVNSGMGGIHGEQEQYKKRRVYALRARSARNHSGAG